MSEVAKRKLSSRTLTEKYKILKELDKGEPSVSISKKYGVPKQTLSGWSKEKNKIYSEVEKNKTSAKRVRIRNENLDKACYIWALKHPTPKHSCVWNHFQSQSFPFCKKTWLFYKALPKKYAFER